MTTTNDLIQKRAILYVGREDGPWSLYEGARVIVLPSGLGSTRWHSIGNSESYESFESNKAQDFVLGTIVAQEAKDQGDGKDDAKSDGHNNKRHRVRIDGQETSALFWPHELRPVNTRMRAITAVQLYPLLQAALVTMTDPTHGVHLAVLPVDSESGPALTYFEHEPTCVSTPISDAASLLVPVTNGNGRRRGAYRLITKDQAIATTDFIWEHHLVQWVDLRDRTHCQLEFKHVKVEKHPDTTTMPFTRVRFVAHAHTAPIDRDQADKKQDDKKGGENDDTNWLVAFDGKDIEWWSFVSETTSGGDSDDAPCKPRAKPRPAGHVQLVDVSKLTKAEVEECWSMTDPCLECCKGFALALFVPLDRRRQPTVLVQVDLMTGARVDIRLPDHPAPIYQPLDDIQCDMVLVKEWKSQHIILVRDYSATFFSTLSEEVAKIPMPNKYVKPDATSEGKVDHKTDVPPVSETPTKAGRRGPRGKRGRRGRKRNGGVSGGTANQVSDQRCQAYRAYWTSQVEGVLQRTLDRLQPEARAQLDHLAQSPCTDKRQASLAKFLADKEPLMLDPASFAVEFAKMTSYGHQVSAWIVSSSMNTERSSDRKTDSQGDGKVENQSTRRVWAAIAPNWNSFRPLNVLAGSDDAMKHSIFDLLDGEGNVMNSLSVAALGLEESVWTVLQTAPLADWTTSTAFRRACIAYVVREQRRRFTRSLFSASLFTEEDARLRDPPASGETWGKSRLRQRDGFFIVHAPHDASCKATTARGDAGDTKESASEVLAQSTFRIQGRLRDEVLDACEQVLSTVRADTQSFNFSTGESYGTDVHLYRTQETPHTTRVYMDARGCVYAEHRTDTVSHSFDNGETNVLKRRLVVFNSHKHRFSSVESATDYVAFHPELPSIEPHFKLFETLAYVVRGPHPEKPTWLPGEAQERWLCASRLQSDRERKKVDLFLDRVHPLHGAPVDVRVGINCTTSYSYSDAAQCASSRALGVVIVWGYHYVQVIRVPMSS